MAGSQEFKKLQPQKLPRPDRKIFGAISKALRMQHLGVSQDVLGDITGLGKAIIVNIENGYKVNLDIESLNRLADAFKLTSMERREFFYSAIGIENDQILVESDFLSGINEYRVIKETICELNVPAFVLDAYGDIILANGIAKCLFDADDSLIEQLKHVPAGWNILYFIFSERTSFEKLLGPSWHSVALNNIFFLRRVSLRYRHTEYFAEVYKALMKLVSFENYWYLSFSDEDEVQVGKPDRNYKIYNYHGMSYVGIDSVTVTSDGELYPVVYLPLDARTTDLFATILARVGKTVHQFSPWPEKKPYWER